MFEIVHKRCNVYEIKAMHVLEQYRYPELQKDCERLARTFCDFAKQHLPELDFVE